MQLNCLFQAKYAADLKARLKPARRGNLLLIRAVDETIIKAVVIPITNVIKIILGFICWVV